MKNNRFITQSKWLLTALITCAFSIAQAEQFEKPCEPEDLIGTWEISSIKNRNGLSAAFFDLLQPYQLIAYSDTGEFRRITFSKRIEQNDALRLLAGVPAERFRVQPVSIIVTTSQEGKVLESYSCSYFIKDNPRINITKDTLSLMWAIEGKVAVLQTYQKIQGSKK